jgi:hypothetical protein
MAALHLLSLLLLLLLLLFCVMHGDGRAGEHNMKSGQGGIGR